MKLVNHKYGLRIKLKEGEVTVIVVEEPHAMVDIVSELEMQVNGKEGDFILSEENNELKMSKYWSMIMNPFSIDLNDRKVLSKLYAELVDEAKNYIEEKTVYNEAAIELLDKIIADSPYQELTYDFDMEWNNFFKLYDMKFESNAGNLLETLLEYIRVTASLFHYSGLILVGIKSYLNEKELQELYRMSCYYKIQLILVESSERKRLENERLYIIDKDICLIVK